MATVGLSLGILLIFILADRIFGKSCSSAPLGLESGKILDDQLQASSEFDSNHLVERSRLNTQRVGDLRGGWSPPGDQNLRDNSWIQVDFLQPTIVTHIGTQGRADATEYVTKYAVQFGFDVNNLIDFENGKIFDGNIDKNTVKTNFLEIPIITRYIRVMPKAFKNHVGMRWELYGCVADSQCKVNALGMKSKAIPDNKISSSTVLSANHSAVRSRLDTTADNAGLGAWIPDQTDPNPWIQVELTKLTRVTRIDTQGRSDAPEWVKTYKLGFRLYEENTTFIDYENGKVFIGNTDHNTTVTNDLDPPVTARIIKLYPLTFEVSRSLRWELYGCVPEPCDDPLGMQTGMILDKKITASSAFSSNTSASRGRLGLMMHGSLAGGWRAAENDNSPWIQIDLSGETTVTRIAVQGRSDVSQWVKTYSLRYGIRDGKLHDYKNGTVFNANTDQNNVVSSILNPPILARYVRLLPQTYHGAAALRMELYGCIQEFCDQALGMQSRALPNECITASTSRSSSYEPFYARLGNRGEGVNLNGAWAPLEIAVNTSWIQVDLLQQTTVSRIATQGHPDLLQWVTDYSIEYGTNESNLMQYENRLNENVFKGNTDQNTIVFNVLDPPVFTRYVRILPKSYQTYVSIRLELYGGCDNLECKGYTRLSSGDRLRTVPLIGSVKCDMDKIGWYRFVVDAGTQIATTCTKKEHCQAHGTGWMNGTHPSPSEGIVRRTVCFSWTTCCQYSTPTHVRNCGPFFVYKFHQSHHCNLRYCGEKVSVGLLSNGVSAEESEAQANIPVRRTESFPYLAINVSISDGTAKSTLDYQDFNPLLVTFSPGQSTVDAIIPLVEDDIYESGGESFAVQLLDSFASVDVQTIMQTIVTINDDDDECYVHKTFNSTDRFENDVTVGSAKCDNIPKGWYRMVGPSGTELATSCASFNKCGANTTLWMNDSHPYENDRRVSRSICYNQNGQCCNRSHNIRVRNCRYFYVYELSSPLICARYCTSKFELFWTETSKVVSENQGNFNLTLIRKGKAIGKLFTRVQVNTSVPYTALPGVDFQQTFIKEEFEPTDTTLIIPGFIVIDDGATESTETFTIAVSTEDGATVTNGLATISITDNDKVSISFKRSSYSVYEDVGFVDIDVTCVGPKEVPIKYRLTTVNDAAIGAINQIANSYGDFIHLSGVEKEFSENEVVQSFRILFYNDSVLEHDEKFSVRLESLVPQHAIVGPLLSTAVIIENDDSVFVEFVKPSMNVNEDNSQGVLQVIMNGTTEIDVKLRISTVNQSAYSTYDYIGISNQLVTFTLTYTSPTFMNISVNITDEVLIERDEHLKMALTTNQKEVRLGRNLTDIYILNNDKAFIGFDLSSLAVFENASNVAVCMYKNGLAAVPLTVTLNTVESTAKANVNYEVMSNQIITFAAPQVQACINVVIIDNNITEYDKIFHIIMTTNDPAVIVQDNRNNLTITILNDDRVSISFERSSYSVYEDVGFVDIDVICVGPKEVPIKYRLTTFNGTAIGAINQLNNSYGDFIHLSGVEKEFSENEVVQSFRILFYNDSVLEHDEKFSVQLESLVPQHAILGPFLSTAVIIENDDSVLVEFVKQFHKVTEDVSTHILQVIMIGTTEIDVNLRISSVNQSAHSTYDYIGISNHLVTFTPTYTSPTFMNISVKITDEVLIERDEHFKKALTTKQKAVRLGRNLTDIYILNNDKAFIGFNFSYLAVFENASNLAVCMYKKGLAAVPLTVTLNTVNSTAKAHVDYEIISNLTITFAAPQVQACINVTIIDNNITEYDKIFHIIMTTQDPAVIVQDNRNNLTITILNDDRVTFEFEELYKTVEEYSERKVDFVCAITEGVAVIPVHVNFTENPIKLIVSTDAGADFVLGNHTLPFHPGTTRLNVTSYIIPDGEVESLEIFSVKIVIPDETRAVAGMKNHAFVKIKDSRDFAKSVTEKQKQETKGKYQRMIFRMCVAAICLLLVITISGVLLFICLIK